MKFSTGRAVCSSDGTLHPSVNLALPRITGTKASVLQTMYGYSPNSVCDNSRTMELLYIKVGDFGVSECLSLCQFCSEHVYNIIITASLYRDTLLNGS